METNDFGAREAQISQTLRECLEGQISRLSQEVGRLVRWTIPAQGGVATEAQRKWLEVVYTFLNSLREELWKIFIEVGQEVCQRVEQNTREYQQVKTQILEECKSQLLLADQLLGRLCCYPTGLTCYTHGKKEAYGPRAREVPPPPQPVLRKRRRRTLQQIDPLTLPPSVVQASTLSSRYSRSLFQSTFIPSEIG